MGLTPEEMVYAKTKKDPRECLVRYGATSDELGYLVTGKNEAGQWCGQRVELNAPTAGELVRFVEQRLAELGVSKVVPDSATLGAAYQRAVRIAALQEAVDVQIRRVNQIEVSIPPGITDTLARSMAEKPAEPWDTSLYRIAKIDPAVGKIARLVTGQLPG